MLRLKDIGLYAFATFVAVSIFFGLIMAQIALNSVIYDQPWLIALFGLPMPGGGTLPLHLFNLVVWSWPGFLAWFLIIRKSRRNPRPLRVVVAFAMLIVLAGMLLSSSFIAAIHEDAAFNLGFYFVVIGGYLVLDRFIYAKSLAEAQA